MGEVLSYQVIIKEILLSKKVDMGTIVFCKLNNGKFYVGLNVDINANLANFSHFKSIFDNFVDGLKYYRNVISECKA